MKRSVLILLIAFAVASLLTSPVSAGEPGEVKIEGKGYFFYYHDMSEGNGQTNSFSLSRMYVGAKYFHSDGFTIRYLTDVYQNNRIEVFTKYAYVDWKVKDNMNLVMGLQGTNNWSMPEEAWGYRQIMYSPMENFGSFCGSAAGDYSSYLANWASDPATLPAKAAELTLQKANFDIARKQKTGSSADLGIGVKCKPCDWGYVDFMIRNGSGYKNNSDNDMFKNFQVRGGAYLLEKALHISAYFELEPYRGIDINGKNAGYNNIQWDLTAAYTIKDLLTAGVDLNGKTFAGIDEVSAMCISVFGHGYVMPEKLKAVVRYDMYTTGLNDLTVKPGDPALKTDGGLIVVGLDYQAHKKVHIIPNFQTTTYEDSNTKSINSVYVHVYFTL